MASSSPSKYFRMESGVGDSNHQSDGASSSAVRGDRDADAWDGATVTARDDEDEEGDVDDAAAAMGGVDGDEAAMIAAPALPRARRTIQGVMFELKHPRRAWQPGDSPFERLMNVTNDEYLRHYTGAMVQRRGAAVPPQKTEHIIRRRFLSELEHRGFTKQPRVLDAIMSDTSRYRADMAFDFYPILVHVEVDEKESHPEPVDRLDEILIQSGCVVHFVLRICTDKLAATQTRHQRRPMIERRKLAGGRDEEVELTPEFDRRMNLLVEHFVHLVHFIESGGCDGVCPYTRSTVNIGWD